MRERRKHYNILWFNMFEDLYCTKRILYIRSISANRGNRLLTMWHDFVPIAPFKLCPMNRVLGECVLQGAIAWFGHMRRGDRKKSGRGKLI